MAPEIVFEQRPSYLFVHVTGHNSAEAVELYMKDVLERCTEIELFRVLIHECLGGERLSPMQIFDLVSEGSARALGKFDAIAFVDEKMGEMANFAETVAVNRGIPIAMFSNLVDAENWIVRQDDDSDSQRIFRGTDQDKTQFRKESM